MTRTPFHFVSMPRNQILCDRVNLAGWRPANLSIKRQPSKTLLMINIQAEFHANAIFLHVINISELFSACGSNNESTSQLTRTWCRLFYENTSSLTRVKLEQTNFSQFVPPPERKKRCTKIVLHFELFGESFLFPPKRTLLQSNSIEVGDKETKSEREQSRNPNLSDRRLNIQLD